MLVEKQFTFTFARDYPYKSLIFMATDRMDADFNVKIAGNILTSFEGAAYMGLFMPLGGDSRECQEAWVSSSRSAYNCVYVLAVQDIMFYLLRNSVTDE